MRLLDGIRAKNQFAKLKRLRKRALDGLVKAIRSDADLACDVACYASARGIRMGGENVNWLDFLRDLPMETEDINGVIAAAANLAVTPPVKAWIEANMMPLSALVHAHILPFEDPSEFPPVWVNMCRNLFYGGVMLGFCSASDAMSSFKKFDEFSNAVGEEFAVAEDPDH